MSLLTFPKTLWNCALKVRGSLFGGLFCGYARLFWLIHCTSRSSFLLWFSFGKRHCGIALRKSLDLFLRSLFCICTTLSTHLSYLRYAEAVLFCGSLLEVSFVRTYVSFDSIIAKVVPFCDSLLKVAFDVQTSLLSHLSCRRYAKYWLAIFTMPYELYNGTLYHSHLHDFTVPFSSFIHLCTCAGLRIYKQNAYVCTYISRHCEMI